jgi:norsolorinic acid ketoreductase
LNDLPHGTGSKIILVQLDSASETDALDAVKIIQSPPHNVTQLDVVIANAGISNYFGKARVTPVSEMLSHFKINTVAPLLLFQATAPLLDASKNPRFVVMSSGAGSISGQDKLKVENTAYGCSKAGANFVTRKIHMENPGIVAFPINPGWLQTDVSPKFRWHVIKT